MSLRPKDAAQPSSLPDEAFLEGATRAVEKAVADLHERSIGTTRVIDGRVVRIHADGRREDLGVVGSRRDQQS